MKPRATIDMQALQRRQVAVDAERHWWRRRLESLQEKYTDAPGAWPVLKDLEALVAERNQ